MNENIFIVASFAVLLSVVSVDDAFTFVVCIHSQRKRPYVLTDKSARNVRASWNGGEGEMAMGRGMERWGQGGGNGEEGRGGEQYTRITSFTLLQ